MTYNTGTATDYLDLLDKLIETITSNHVSAIALNNAGTGGAYLVGDILTIDGTGGTFTSDAQIEVLTVSGSQIATARIYRGGAYSTDPSTLTGNAVTGGGGTGATFDLTMLDTGWSELTRQSETDAIPTVAAGGTGYATTEVLTLVGGVLAPGGTAATFTVATVGTTDVATVTILDRGDYEVFPPSPVATTVSPGGGTGCTLTVTKRDTTGDTRVVLQGNAGAALDPTIGIVTYSDRTDEGNTSTVYNWALFGMTSWGSLFALHDQPNISDGFHATAADGTLTASTAGDGAFVPLKDADAFNISWTIRATGRNVTMVARVEGPSTVHYAQCSFGLFNQFGTTTEITYPAYVAGTSDRPRVWYRDSASIFGGLTDCIGRTNGPIFCWTPESSWVPATAGVISTNTDLTPTYGSAAYAINDRVGVWPLAAGATNTDLDDATWAIAGSAGFDNDDLTVVGSAVSIYRTPDTGGDLFPLFPCTITQADGGSGFYRVLGEIDGVWWFHTAGELISSGDRFTQGGSAYTIFQNGTRIEPISFMALRED